MNLNLIAISKSSDNKYLADRDAIISWVQTLYIYAKKFNQLNPSISFCAYSKTVVLRPTYTNTVAQEMLWDLSSVIKIQQCSTIWVQLNFSWSFSIYFFIFILNF